MSAQPSLQEWLVAQEKHRERKADPKRLIPRARTPQRAKEERIYRARVKVWLELPENRWCHIWCAKKGVNPSAVDVDGWVLIPPDFKWARCPRSTECHHIDSRHGKRLLDETKWCPASHEHHAWVKENQSAARSIGVLI